MKHQAEWDARFRAGDHAGSEPDPFLVSAKELLAELLPQRAAALDLACGAGRHAVWLAEQGFRVTAVDFSEEALGKARVLAEARGLSLDLQQWDLESPDLDLGPNVYDLICGFFFLHRPLFPGLRRALRPGGLIIYKTYSTDQLRYPGRPRHPMHLLEPNELLRLLAGFRVLRYEERWTPAGTEAVVARLSGSGTRKR